MRRLVLAVCIAATVFIGRTARADGVLPGAATAVQREQAQSRFMRGKDLMTKKQYDQALVEFKASHDIVSSPNARLEIARCEREMGKLVAAYAELGRTAIEAKELVAQDNRYQRTYDSATTERAELEPQLGFVTLTITNATDQTTVTVDGEEIRRAAWSEPAPVAPKNAEIVVTTPGHASVTKPVSLAAGQKQALTIDAFSGDATGAPPPPPPPPPPAEESSSGIPLRTWAYVAGGVGAAGLLTFTIGGLMAKSTYDDLNSACHGGPCPSDKSGEISSGKTQQTIANVGLVVGILGVGAGATLFVLSMPKSSEPAAAPAPATAVVVGPGWAGLRGQW
jgi:hypothetical protein